MQATGAVQLFLVLSLSLNQTTLRLDGLAT